MADTAPLNSNPILELYVGTFARAPDLEGLQYWQNLYDNGILTLAGIASNMMMSPEAQQRYPGGVSNEQLIWLLYTNLFDRNPDIGGFNYWVPLMNNGTMPREMTIAYIVSGARAPSGNPNDATVFSTRVAKSIEYLNKVATGETMFNLAGAEAVVVGVHREDVANIDLEPLDLCGRVDVCGNGVDEDCSGADLVCSDTCIDQPDMAEISGVWDFSYDAGVLGHDVIYVQINADGSYRVFDYAGDTFDNEGNCYRTDQGQLTSLGNGVFIDSYDGTSASFKVCGDQLTISDNSGSETYSRATVTDFTPICK